MRKLVFSINMSLDGFANHTVAAPDNEILDFFSGLLDDTGIELFGRVTYQLMADYWPHANEDPAASRSDRDFADRFNSMPKIVFSSTMEKAVWNNTTLVKGDALEHVTKLKETDGKNLGIGGIKLAGSLMSHGLIDEYWLLIHPVIAGEGRRLFEGETADRKLSLIETIRFKGGAVALHYRETGR